MSQQSSTDIHQLKEFLSVYNYLTEICFSSCVRDFGSKKLAVDEQDCVKKCIDKLMGANRRLMLVFADLGPEFFQKQQEQAAATAAAASNPVQQT